ncbi:hypothetical protein E0H54_30670 [Rhizobium leguminosarum bv. viciae]|nr:hypothetical protein E0H54_30670 [Rhizobium leguminosarum bv. viciae]
MPCERGGRGTERSRHIAFAPRAGRRCRQADEGLVRRFLSRRLARQCPKTPSCSSSVEYCSRSS